mgnify:CR=1 FL=1
MRAAWAFARDVQRLAGISMIERSQPAVAGRHPILVMTGMHRSGTSLTASILQSAGLFIGDRLLPSSGGKEASHFEDIEFYELHKRALTANGYRDDGFVDASAVDFTEPLNQDVCRLIDARQALGRAWGWKDPRTVLFVDIWQRLLPDAGFLFVFRSPWDVVDSLYRRGDECFQANPPHALAVWRYYNKIILEFVRRNKGRSALFEIGQIISRPHEMISTVRGQFGIPLKDPASLFQKELFLQVPDRYRREFVRERAPECVDIYEELRSLAKVPDDPMVTESMHGASSGARVLLHGGLTEWARVRQQERLLEAAAEELAGLKQAWAGAMQRQAATDACLRQREEVIQSLEAEKVAIQEAERRAHADCDQLQSAHNAAAQEALRLSAVESQLLERIRALAEKERLASEQRDAILASNSWRFTKPLRACRRWLSQSSRLIAYGRSVLLRMSVAGPVRRRLGGD